jgi:hypothetical protein
MDKELCNVIDKIAEKIGIAIDWSSENVMPYIQDVMQRYRTMSIVENIIVMSVCAIIITICNIVAVKMIKGIINGFYNGVSSIWIDADYGDSCYDQISGLSVATGAIIILAFLVSFILFGFATGELIRWIYVPELKFLEMLKGLIN